LSIRLHWTEVAFVVEMVGVLFPVLLPVDKCWLSRGLHEVILRAFID
jgi:hypothetical protein